MTREHTPTDSQVIDDYQPDEEDIGFDARTMSMPEWKMLKVAAFNRWLADHDAKIRADVLNGLKPDDGGWYPNDGAVVVNGKLYFEADYMLIREDIQRMRADAWDEGFTEGRDLAVSDKPMTRNNPYKEQKQ